MALTVKEAMLRFIALIEGSFFHDKIYILIPAIGNMMSTFNHVRNSALETIEDAEGLATAYGAFLNSEFGIELQKLPFVDSESYTQAKSSINSSLIKVIVCGEFSSGKSFLISSLLNEIEFAPGFEEDTGYEVEDYFTLLPTGPTQTNSCPLEIRGNGDASYKLEVLFIDSEEYQLVADNINEKLEINNLLWAYATNVERYKTFRHQSDENRGVRGAKLFVPHMPFEAVFYDLPGIGGVSAPYKDLVNSALKEADCIIFVSFARRELTDLEIGLIGEIEANLRLMSSKRKVFFLLSAKISTDQAKVQEVLNKDNALLIETFPNEPFDRAKFSVVTPGKEAIATQRYSNGQINEAQRDLLYAASNTPDLREKLTEYLQTQSGPARIRFHLNQIQFLIKAIEDNTRTFEQIYSKDIVETKQDLARTTEKISTLTNSRLSLSSRLDELDERSKRTVITLAPDQLAKYLHDRLDKFISEKKINNPPLLLEFNRNIEAYSQEWLNQKQYVTSVQKALDAYVAQARSLVRANIGIEIYPNPVPVTPLENPKDDPGGFTTQGSDSALRSNLDSAVKAIGLLGIGGGGTVAALAAMGTAGLALSAGLPAIIGGAFFLGLSFLDKNRALSETRKMARAYVDEFAVTRCNLAIQQIGLAIEEIRQGIEVQIDGHINELRNEEKARSERLEKGDLREVIDKVNMLRDFRERAEAIALKASRVIREL